MEDDEDCSCYNDVVLNQDKCFALVLMTVVEGDLDLA